MSSVFVWPSDGSNSVQQYEGATGVKYDQDGYAVITRQEGDKTFPVAIWAPGRWQRADLREDR